MGLYCTYISLNEHTLQTCFYRLRAWGSLPWSGPATPNSGQLPSLERSRAPLLTPRLLLTHLLLLSPIRISAPPDCSLLPSLLPSRHPHATLIPSSFTRMPPSCQPHVTIILSSCHPRVAAVFGNGITYKNYLQQRQWCSIIALDTEAASGTRKCILDTGCV